MNTQKRDSQLVNTGKKVQVSELSFKLILKFWKKKSQSFDLDLPIEFCKSKEDFVEAVIDIFQIEKEFCLEEVWVMQQCKSYESTLDWIMKCNGRIKLSIEDSYKEFLMKTGDKKVFDDPTA